MRWRIHLRFLGMRYAGWQRQPAAPSVQEELEKAFSVILREPIAVTGCGRTDAGVHARHYVAHMDAVGEFDPSRLVYQVNAILPPDIALCELLPAASDFHARFDATARLYRYYLHFRKDPFLAGRSMYFPRPSLLHPELLHQTAGLLLAYDRFKPFCKTGSDARHFLCTMMTSHWTIDAEGGVYTVQANRFLRGMVRLIVGTCLQVGTGKMSVEEIRLALERQTPLAQAWRVPADGLFLEEVTYREGSDSH